MTTAKNLFSEEQKEEITQAIRHAEHDCSGEIRVHIENSCKGDVLDRAAYIFKKFGIHNKEQRNNVLFYVAVKHRKFAILGDAGINAVVPADFWDDIKEVLLTNFKEGKYTEGLCKGIEMAGEHLKKNFPHHKEDTNEQPDDLSFG